MKSESHGYSLSSFDGKVSKSTSIDSATEYLTSENWTFSIPPMANRNKLPLDLSQYMVSPWTGFLPEIPPLARLPSPYYDYWEILMGDLHTLITDHRLRDSINSLPILETVHLRTLPEYQRAYTILSFLTHGYIWEGFSKAPYIPANIAIPFKKVADYLHMPPVATYASLCLWNYEIRNAEDDRKGNRHGSNMVDEELIGGLYEGSWSLDRISPLHTYTNTRDEEWFYTISIAIEIQGAPVIPLLLQAIEMASANRPESVTTLLYQSERYIFTILQILKRMRDHCTPSVFYHHIRPFFMAGEFGYQDDEGDVEYQTYSGGSNAQSSLIQFLDIALGVEHAPLEHNETGTPIPATQTPQLSYLHKMRSYMPKPHARFLGDLQKIANIRPFVVQNMGNQSLVASFKGCIDTLSAVRDEHIKIAGQYIVVPHCRSSTTNSITQTKSRPELAGPDQSCNEITNPLKTQSRTSAMSHGCPHNHDQQTTRSTKIEVEGTGGTQLMPFLKRSRDETKQANQFWKPWTS